MGVSYCRPGGTLDVVCCQRSPVPFASDKLFSFLFQRPLDRLGSVALLLAQKDAAALTLAKPALHQHCGHTAGQIGHIGREVVIGFFDHNGKGLAHVPGVRSPLGLPATVTRPGRCGCLNCLWLLLITMRIFTPMHRTLVTCTVG